MTKKYIVRNCPAMTDQGNCFQGSLFLGTAYQDCCERTDCLFKQIVEKCKPHSEICKECDSDDCFECEHLMAGGLANKILSMLEIQECE